MKASEDGGVVTFGKHNGKSYGEVYTTDQKYCDWILSVNNPSGVMKSFADFIRRSKENNRNQVSVTPNRKRSDFTSPSAFTSVPAELFDKYKYNSTSIHNTPPRTPPLPIKDHMPPPQRQLPLSMQRSCSAAGNYEDTTPVLGSVINTEMTDLSGVVCLQVVSNSTFKVTFMEKRFRGKPQESNFLPRSLYDRLSRIKVPTRGEPFLIDASKYSEVVQMLQQEFRCEVEKIPSFILRAFSGFRTVASPAKLQRKAGSILLGLQTPRTLSRAPLITSQLGAALSDGLRPFQIEGVEFGLQRNGRALIGDEMGLGKTLQALAIIAIYANEWPALVICPSSISFQWRDQAKRWLSHLLTSPDTEVFVVRKGSDEIPRNAKIIIVSYDLLAKNPKFQICYDVVVCDESHYLKNNAAKRTQMIIPIIQKSKRALLLSGTPALNKPVELFQQLLGLIPGFAKYDDFANRYCETSFNPWAKKIEFTGSRHGEELNNFLTTTVMIRRLKKDVQKELPPKLRSRIPVECSPKELKEIQTKMLELNSVGGHLLGMSEEGQMNLGSSVEDGENDKGVNSQLIVDAESTDVRECTVKLPSEKSPQSLISELFVLTGRAKAKGACEYISYLLQLECKFLVFAHHRHMLDALEAQMVKEKVKHIRIDGSTPHEKREKLITQFQTNDEMRVAVLSITACGHGLNLTASGTVVFAELYWVPGHLIQAEDRCHRMGTTFSTIHIHYLIAEGTVDDLVWKTLNRKWNNITTTLNGKMEHLDAQHLSRNEALAEGGGKRSIQLRISSQGLKLQTTATASGDVASEPVGLKGIVKQNHEGSTFDYLGDDRDQAADLNLFDSPSPLITTTTDTKGQSGGLLDKWLISSNKNDCSGHMAKRPKIQSSDDACE